MNWIKTKDGKEYPIKFSQAAKEKWQRHNNITTNGLKDVPGNFLDWELEMLYSYIWYAIYFPCKDKKIDFPYTDFDSWVVWIEQDDTILPQCLEYWFESIPKEEAGVKKQRAATEKSR